MKVALLCLEGRGVYNCRRVQADDVYFKGTRSTGVPEMTVEISGWPASLGSPVGMASRVTIHAPSVAFPGITSGLSWWLIKTPLLSPEPWDSHR